MTDVARISVSHFGREGWGRMSTDPLRFSDALCVRVCLCVYAEHFLYLLFERTDFAVCLF